MNKSNLIYIMGRGHSGSTVLDAILGNSSEIESVGEFISGCTAYDQSCSCGVVFIECDYWKKIREHYEKNNKSKWDESCRQVKKITHIKYYIKILFAKKNSNSFKGISKINNSLFQSISECSNKKYIIDSSKEVTRGIFLLKFTENTKIIHLVKNPENILASNYYRIKSGRGFKFLRKKYTNKNLLPILLLMSCIGWILGNLFAELIKNIFKKRVILIRFEDLNKNTKITLNRLSEFIGINLDDIIESVIKKKELEIGHNIGGNHMRMQKTFYFKESEELKRPLPKSYKILTRLIAWPLYLLYGYRIF